VHDRAVWLTLSSSFLNICQPDLTRLWPCLYCMMKLLLSHDSWQLAVYDQSFVTSVLRVSGHLQCKRRVWSLQRGFEVDCNLPFNLFGVLLCFATSIYWVIVSKNKNKNKNKIFYWVSCCVLQSNAAQSLDTEFLWTCVHFSTFPHKKYI
jgi:hypothetical protein